MNDQSGIDASRQEWIGATNAADPERCVATMDTDIVWFPPGMEPLEGRQAVHEWMVPFFQRFEYDFSVADVQLRLAGEWAVERGTYTSRLTSREDAKTSSHTGRYLLIWHRETDGRWYMDRYVDITDMTG